MPNTLLVHLALNWVNHLLRQELLTGFLLAVLWSDSLTAEKKEKKKKKKKDSPSKINHK